MYVCICIILISIETNINKNPFVTVLLVCSYTEDYYIAIIQYTSYLGKKPKYIA